ncbi:MAG: FKBP-type peptidyl-prolyl cis-trans isomerase [Candidatus Heimdallarchaeota archaeon]|nr:FKBP-type peptidyl-prolyl cis-trans isomerase [Candidatus Heimdallarchaeota archaeon]
MSTGSAYTHEGGIETGDEVSMTYILTVDGYVKDSARADDPFVTVISNTKLIQGFYEAVLGMKVKESKSFVVPPEKGYSSGELAGKDLYFDVTILEITMSIQGERITAAPPDDIETEGGVFGGNSNTASIISNIFSSPIFQLAAVIVVVFVAYTKLFGK